MTEDDAKTKWCPFARCGEAGLPGLSHNREYAGGVARNTFCIASACMAWGRARAPVAEAITAMVKEGTDWRDDRLLREKQYALRPAGGYCGLAEGLGQ